MAAAYVQSDTFQASFAGSPTLALAFGGNVVAGNLIVGSFCWDGDIALTSITDSQTNTYTIEAQINNGTTSHLVIFYTLAGSSGACTVTATLASAASRMALTVHEASGIASSSPRDQFAGQSQSNPGTGTDAVTSGGVTTTENGEYIYGATGDPGYSTGKTQGTGYTARETDNGPYTMSEDQIQVSAGSIAATFTIDGFAVILTGIATFKAAAVGGGGGFRSRIAGGFILN
jgi:hypothetical protein